MEASNGGSELAGSTALLASWRGFDVVLLLVDDGYSHSGFVADGQGLLCERKGKELMLGAQRCMG